MTLKQRTAQSAPAAGAASWDLRHPGCIMKGANGEEIHEFMGMWPLKPDADLVDLANTLSRGRRGAIAQDRRLLDCLRAVGRALER